MCLIILYPSYLGDLHRYTAAEKVTFLWLFSNLADTLT